MSSVRAALQISWHSPEVRLGRSPRTSVLECVELLLGSGRKERRHQRRQRPEEELLDVGSFGEGEEDNCPHP